MLLKQFIQTLHFHFLSVLPTPYKTYFNSGRYPCKEIAELYNDVVNVYVKEDCKGYDIKFKKLGYEESNRCNKYDLVHTDSDAMIEMDRTAYAWLEENEIRQKKKQDIQLQFFYEGFYHSRCEARSFKEINLALDVITERLTTMTKFEIARHLPLWLLWYYNVSHRQLLAWMQSNYFTYYLNNIDKRERRFVVEIWNYYLATQVHSENGFALTGNIN